MRINEDIITVQSALMIKLMQKAQEDNKWMFSPPETTVNKNAEWKRN